MQLIIDSLWKKRSLFQIRAEGVSMAPLLHSGDILYLKKVPFSQVKVNDLAMARKRNNIVTHRMIYKTDGYLITKGDNNLISDGKIYPNQLIGKAEEVKRYGQMVNLDNLYLLQSTLYFQEIVRIKKALEKEKTDFIILKGLPLYLYFIKSHPRRIYADCDVLISKNDWEKANEILVNFCYRKAETSFSRIHHLLKNKPTEIVYFRKINDFPIVFDIHLEAGFLMNQLGKLDALYSQKLIDVMTERFLKEKRMIEIQSESFSVLSPSNLIIYLALHFFHHNYRGIFRLEFLYKILKKESREEDLFLEISHKVKQYLLQNFVSPTFLLLEKYYDLKLQMLLDSIKPNDNKLRYINENILKINIFDDESRIKAGVDRFKNIFFLSPYPLIKRLLILSNPQVIYSYFWIITFLARRSLIKAFKSS